MKSTQFLVCKLIFLSLFSLASRAQSGTFSSIKFGSIKVTSTLDSVNNHLEQKVTVKPFRIENEVRYDTSFVHYNGASLRLIFQNVFDGSTKRQETSLISIYSDDKAISTRSGIKLGISKFDLIRMLDGSVLSVAPDTERGKRFSQVYLFDQTSGNRMVFYFKDNILYAIEIQAEEEYDC